MFLVGFVDRMMMRICWMPWGKERVQGALFY